MYAASSRRRAGQPNTDCAVKSQYCVFQKIRGPSTPVKHCKRFCGCLFWSPLLTAARMLQNSSSQKKGRKKWRSLRFRLAVFVLMLSVTPKHVVCVKSAPGQEKEELYFWRYLYFSSRTSIYRNSRNWFSLHELKRFLQRPPSAHRSAL